jgi:hypothetical protein
MYYIVFSRSRNKDGGLTSNIYYEGVSKTSALESFDTASASTFKIDAAACNLYFAGFQSDLPVIKELVEEATSLVASEKINKVIRNLSLATCLNTLTSSGYKPAKLIEVRECEECDNKDTTVEQNVYKDYLCSECWAEYWNTRKSLAEYVVNLAKGIDRLDSFSEADKQVIVEAWTTNERDKSGNTINNSSNRKRMLNSGYTEEELVAIETASGLNFTVTTSATSEE